MRDGYIFLQAYLTDPFAREGYKHEIFDRGKFRGHQRVHPRGAGPDILEMEQA
jgi:hypothetical protein